MPRRPAVGPPHEHVAPTADALHPRCRDGQPRADLVGLRERPARLPGRPVTRRPGTDVRTRTVRLTAAKRATYDASAASGTTTVGSATPGRTEVQPRNANSLPSRLWRWAVASASSLAGDDAQRARGAGEGPLERGRPDRAATCRPWRAPRAGSIVRCTDVVSPRASVAVRVTPGRPGSSWSMATKEPLAWSTKPRPGARGSRPGSATWSPTTRAPSRAARPRRGRWPSPRSRPAGRPTSAARPTARAMVDHGRDVARRDQRRRSSLAPAGVGDGQPDAVVDRARVRRADGRRRGRVDVAVAVEVPGVGQRAAVGVGGGRGVEVDASSGRRGRTAPSVVIRATGRCGRVADPVDLAAAGGGAAAPRRWRCRRRAGRRRRR